MPNKGYDPASKNELPGGRYKSSSFFQDVSDISHHTPPKEDIGSKAGTATRREGIVGKVGRAIDEPDIGLRAYTPEEAQKAQAGVDADTMREQASKAKGAVPSSFKSGGVVQRTGMALVHEGEVIIPKKEVDARATRIVAPNAGWLVCPENAGKYTGDNAPWRR